MTKLSKSDAYRIYMAGNSLWHLDILHEGNQYLVLQDLKTIYANLEGIKMGPGAPSLIFMKFKIDKSPMLQTLLPA